MEDFGILIITNKFQEMFDSDPDKIYFKKVMKIIFKLESEKRYILSKWNSMFKCFPIRFRLEFVTDIKFLFC